MKDQAGTGLGEPFLARADNTAHGLGTDVEIADDDRALSMGLAAAVALMVAAVVVPFAFGWDVNARSDGNDYAPLHGFDDLKVGPGTIPALVLAFLAFRYAATLSRDLAWRQLLALSFCAAAAWMLALAFVDGPQGISRVLGNSFEYLQTARATTDIHAMLGEYVSRIPYAAKPDNWPTHVAGHPPGALLFFIGLVRLGLGGDFAAGLVVTIIAATTAAAILVTLRALGAEAVARRTAPFITFTPAAIFMAVSADALFAATAAWGLAALALAATTERREVRRPRVSMVSWSLVSGVALGWCVMFSYGLPLLGVLALAVLMSAKSWWPLPLAAIAALGIVLAFAAGGFAWWEAYPVLVERYYDGIASQRPMAYWAWGNLAALLFCTGPLVGAGLVATARQAARHRGTGLSPERAGVSPERAGNAAAMLLVGAATLTIAIADLSGMSRSEVERIWLPFAVWLTIALAFLPQRWRYWGFGLQLAFALVIQHGFYTSW